MKSKTLVKVTIVSIFVLLFASIACKKNNTLNTEESSFFYYKGTDRKLSQIIKSLSELNKINHFTDTLTGKGQVQWDKAIKLVVMQRKHSDSVGRYLVPLTIENMLTSAYLEINYRDDKVSSPIIHTTSALANAPSTEVFNVASTLDEFSRRGLKTVSVAGYLDKYTGNKKAIQSSKPGKRVTSNNVCHVQIDAYWEGWYPNCDYPTAVNMVYDDAIKRLHDYFQFNPSIQGVYAGAGNVGITVVGNSDYLGSPTASQEIINALNNTGWIIGLGQCTVSNVHFLNVTANNYCITGPVTPGTPGVSLAANDIIDDFKSFPCASDILLQLPYLKNDIAEILNNTFNNSCNFHITFEAGKLSSGGGTYTDGETTLRSKILQNPSDPNSNVTYIFSIVIDEEVLKHATKEYILATMYHEAIHAYLMSELETLGIAEYLTKYPDVDFNVVSQPYFNANQALFVDKHSKMAVYFLNSLVQAVKSYNSNLNENTVNAISATGIIKRDPNSAESVLNQNERDIRSNHSKGTKCP